jgi:hypothetical protein
MMHYLLLGSVLLEFDQYLVICFLSFSIVILTSKELGFTNGSAAQQTFNLKIVINPSKMWLQIFECVSNKSKLYS